MNKVCKDCLHAYGDLYGMSYLCSTCENGSCFTPSVIYTQLTVRQEWPNSVTTRMQAAQMASDIKRMANALEDLVGLYLVNDNPTFFQLLDYIIRVYGTVLLVHGDGYVSILLGKNNSILIPIKDLKKISDKKIPKGSCSSPRFNNGDHVLHTHNGKNRFLAIEGWVIDNKPYYNECKIVIRTLSGKHMIVNECDTRTIYEYRYFDTDMAYKQKLKEVSNMLNDGRIVQFTREGNTITATLYDTKEIGNGSKSHTPIVSASAKCHPDDRFDIDLGMDIAFRRLAGKWKLINKKSNLQKFKDGEIWVKTDKEDFIDFMAICERQDISWPKTGALGHIPYGLINGRPIHVKVYPEDGYMFYRPYPLDSKPVITVSDLLK